MVTSYISMVQSRDLMIFDKDLGIEVVLKGSKNGWDTPRRDRHGWFSGVSDNNDSWMGHRESRLLF